jgi:hypothetical protein
MNNGKVIFQIEKVDLGGLGDVKSVFNVQCDTDNVTDLVKAFISTSIQNPQFGEMLKYVVTALKKRETPLMPPKIPYQA